MNCKPFFGAVLFSIAFLMLSNSAFAQRGGNSGIRFLMNKDIQTELELQEEQVEDIQELQSDAQDIYRELLSQRSRMQNMDEDERKELMEGLNTDMENLNTQADEILLPHQKERLEQIVLQSQIRSLGGWGALTSNESMREKIGLSEDEAADVKEKQAEVQKELLEKIKKLRKEADDEILSVLPDELQEKVKGMVGDPFEFQRTQRRTTRGQRGRGGPRGGGQRGGGPRGGGGGGGNDF